MQTVVAAVRGALVEHDDADTLVRHQALILAPSVDEAATIATAWNTAAPGEAAVYVGATPPSVLTDFKAEHSPLRALVVCMRLTEGFDHPRVSAVGILRNVQPASKSYFSQFVGRAVRKAHADDPVTGVVISHVCHAQRGNFDALDHVAEVDPEDAVDDDGAPAAGGAGAAAGGAGGAGAH